MRFPLQALSLSIMLIAFSSVTSAIAQDAASAPTTNPATEKLQADMKAAVLNGSITIPQLKELQANAAILKEARAAQKPGAPIDMLTPYHAVSNMKAVMAQVKPGDRETLDQDLQAVLANQHSETASTEPPSPGKQLGKDIFKAVMFGKPTDAQVKQLQDSLDALQKLKSEQGGPLQAFRTLKSSKSQIEEVMNAGSFRPQDRQAVLDDLNSLGPQGGGMRRQGR